MFFQSLGPLFRFGAVLFRHVLILGNRPMLRDQLALILTRQQGQALGLFAVCLLLLWCHGEILLAETQRVRKE